MIFDCFTLIWAGRIPDEILYYIHHSFKCDTGAPEVAAIEIHPIMLEYVWFVYSEEQADRCELFIRSLIMHEHYYSYVRKKEKIPI